MSLFRKAIAGLYDGVSQQSATLRTPLQAEEQVNAWATIADGLQKRPPSVHIAKVSPVAFGAATVHHINRDTAERYIVVVTDGDLRVFDHTTGTEVTVNFPTGKAYLDCADAAKDFALVTVADYTFVVNRTKTVALEPAGASIDNSDNRWLNRNVTGLDVFAGAVFQYPFAPTAGELYMGEKQRFEDLPDTATNGHIYKITGTGDNGFSTYFVKRVGGVWEEYRDPALTQNRLLASSMPHALVREANGTFSFAPFSWAERKVGDANSNPVPTFVGRAIRDVFFVQNRLGFLIDENVVLSCAADFGNFWRNTVTALVASDTVDVAVTGQQVSLLYHAIPFNDTVVLFSDQTQFILSWGQEGLTPDSVALTPVTSYSVNVDAKPVQSGRDVYFAANSGGYTKVYEYYNRPSSEGSLTDAANITAHVPRYIPSDILRLAAAVSDEAIFVVPSSTRHRLYVYKYAWGNAQEKAQSSWSYWEFDSGAIILSAACLDGFVYLLMQRADGVFLERIELSTQVPSFGLSRTVHLDRQVQLTGTYDAPNDRTIFQLPYVYSQAAIRVVQGAGSPVPEALLDPSQYVFVSGTHVAVPGNRSGYPCVLGCRYTMRYTFSPQFATTDTGAILTGRTILRSMTVRYTESAFFKTEVSPYGSSPAVEAVVPAKLAEFTGKTLGEASLILGQPVYGTGDYTFQVYGEAEVARVTLVNDTHVASAFQSAEIEITYHNRSR